MQQSEGKTQAEVTPQAQRTKRRKEDFKEGKKIKTECNSLIIIVVLKNYSVSFDTPDGKVQAVRNVDLTVKKGEILCIVGESGCGKTVMCRSVMKLLPPNAHVKSGEISLCGENITAYKRKKMEKLIKEGKGLITVAKYMFKKSFVKSAWPSIVIG